MYVALDDTPFVYTSSSRPIKIECSIINVYNAQAMLECDVVGFHTFNYARHFLQARIFYRRFPFIV